MGRQPNTTIDRAWPQGDVPVRGVVLLFAVLALVALWPAQASGADDEDWIVEGGGWGHGIGLSQYGAYGMALDGYNADEILSHYYSGAFPVLASDSLGIDHWLFDPESLWIGLEQHVLGVELEAVGGELSLCQTGDGTDDCVVPDAVIAEGSSWVVEVVAGADPMQCQLVDLNTGVPAAPADCFVDVLWVDDADPEDPDAATRVRVNGGREYAHGSLHIRPDDANPAIADDLHVAIAVGLADYVAGIGEIPSSWPTAALEAQAMIARSYGVAAATTRAPEGELPGYRQRLCWCHLVDTSSDQNYVGWSKESEGTDAIWGKRWVAAVDATTGEVLNHPSTGSTIISTYYSSSTGGATENNEDVWGGAPREYLRSVDDHWAIGENVSNPYATWSVAVTRPTMLDALDEGWDAAVSARTIDGPPGTVIEFTGTIANTKMTTTRNGNWFRSKFGVRSPFVSAAIAGWTIPPFVDIEESIHYASIAYIWQEGITKGCNPPDNDRYCPNSTVTRGQMAALLVRALDLTDALDDPFVDDDTSVFESDIEKLAAAGITKGCNPPANDRFCPEHDVTREQMAAFLVRAFAYSDAGGGDLFVDDDGSPFEADIDRLATAGVTKGCNPPTNDRFCPSSLVTREQMATFLYRALG